MTGVASIATMDAREREILLWLVGHDSRETLPLLPDEILTSDGLPEITGSELASVLHHAEDVGYVVADHEDRGGMELWTRVRMTIAGLRALGEWPPAGAEHRPGPWDTRRWGTVSRPLLAGLATDPPEGGVVLKPLGHDPPEEWQRWTDLLRLHEAGLVKGALTNEALQDVQLTRQGRDVLAPPADDPLRRARADLDRGAKADAVTAAIDEALKPGLHRLADAHDVQRTKRNGDDENLGVINDQLKAAGAYDKSHHGEIFGWLAIRNVAVHGAGATVNDRRIERLIVGVEGFLEERGAL